MLAGTAPALADNGPPAERIYDPERTTLYDQRELFEGFDAAAHHPRWDRRAYDAYIATGKYRPSDEEARARAIHDGSITQALHAYLDAYRAQPSSRGIVAIMGDANEHMRCSPVYKQTVTLGYDLAQAGYLVVTGGGPGLMEAANLGAYLADQPRGAIDEAIGILTSDADAQGCSYADSYAYDAAALRVLHKYGSGHANLGVPTWFYGHEPANAFATANAKYFSNGIREDELIASGTDGVIYVTGRAGMRQEIFQDQTQNHFATYCRQKPMVFVGTGAFGDSGLYEMARGYAATAGMGAYDDLLTLTDDVGDVVPFLAAHPSRFVEAEGCPTPAG